MNGEYAVAAPSSGTSNDDWAVLTARVPLVAATMQGFLAQQAVTLAPATIVAFNEVLRRFGLWLSVHDPNVAGVADVTRAHIEAFKIKCSTDTHSLTGEPLAINTIRRRLRLLKVFFDRITPGQEVAFASCPVW